MASNRPIRCGTLDNIPGIDDDFRTMYRNLKRMESSTSIISDISEEGVTLESANGNDDSGDLAERLHGVDLKDADAIWSKLSESERQQIGQVMQQQRVMAALPTFNPWWENKVQRIQISEVNGDQSSIVSTEHEWRDLQHPKIKKTIAEFSQISKEPPNQDIDNNLTNVLAAYTSTVRFFYGEHLRSAYEAVKYLFVICSSLKSNSSTFIDPQLAIESVRKEARKEGLTIEDDDLLQMKKDIDNITEGPDPNHQTNCYILAALSDLYRLFQLAKVRSSFRQQSNRAVSSISGSKTMEIVPPLDQAKDFQRFINRFGDYKILEFISMDIKQMNATMEKVEYFLAYAKRFLTYS